MCQGRPVWRARVSVSIWNAGDRAAFVLAPSPCQQNSPRKLEGSESLTHEGPVQLPFPPSSQASLPSLLTREPARSLARLWVERPLPPRTATPYPQGWQTASPLGRRLLFSL